MSFSKQLKIVFHKFYRFYRVLFGKTQMSSEIPKFKVRQEMCVFSKSFKVPSEQQCPKSHSFLVEQATLGSHIIIVGLWYFHNIYWWIGRLKPVLLSCQCVLLCLFNLFTLLLKIIAREPSSLFQFAWQHAQNSLGN